MADAIAEIWNKENTVKLASQFFEDVQISSVSPDVEVLFWNGRGRDDCDKMTRVRVTAACGSDVDGQSYTGNTNPLGQEGVTERWVEIKSKGTVGDGIVDDDMDTYKSIGGDPNLSVNNYISLGDIPSNCARRLFLHFNVPAGAETAGGMSLRFRCSYM